GERGKPFRHPLLERVLLDGLLYPREAVDGRPPRGVERDRALEGGLRRIELERALESQALVREAQHRFEVPRALEPVPRLAACRGDGDREIELANGIGVVALLESRFARLHGMLELAIDAIEERV